MLRTSTRLNLNEMPYPPSADVLAAARKGLSELHRYTNAEELDRLREQLAEYSKVPKRHIVLSPGSDLLLREIIHTYSKGRQVVMVSPSFFPTVRAAKQFATKRLAIRLSPPTFDLDPDLLMKALEKRSLVIIDNPNNPTGSMLLDRQAVEATVGHREVLLVIDEAYYEFSGVTFANMVADCPHLVVIRTMDKAFSLAGARIGYAIAGEAFLDTFSTFYALLPRPSLYAAREALRNPVYMRKNVRQIIEERDRLRETLDELGARVYPSSTNFLLVRTRAPDVARRLGDVGVLISDVSNQLPPGFIRVSIGAREENDAFLAAFMEIRETGE
jgi:histidinol-phosphate aminotransferase